jgi:hypothetical protein
VTAHISRLCRHDPALFRELRGYDSVGSCGKNCDVAVELMKLAILNKPRLICVTLSFALAACTTSDQYSFLHYGRTPASNATNLETPVLSDQLALLYASNVATILRSRFTGARITREISSSLQVILAGLAGAGAALNFGETTLAVLGLGSAAIPEFQGIFNAKGRAECYQDAVRLIEEAQIEYLAHNQQPRPDVLTQNGVTVFQRVTASIHVVEKTLAGHLPSVEDMQKATERMSKKGATPTAPGAALNNLTANPRVQAAADREVAEVETVSREKYNAVIAQLNSERERRGSTIAFVAAVRQLDRDPALQEKKKALYSAILAETGLTETVQPDATAMIGFFQTTATEDQKLDLTEAVNKHIH